VMDAGWSEREVRASPDGTFEVREDTVHGLLAEASSVLAGSPRLELDSCGVGLKPVPGGDGEPVLGPVPGVAGCFVAFTHSGATLALVVGELLAEQVLDGAAPPLLEPFGVGRFLPSDPPAT
jgi:glycine/D-amino acid oxidase-like deaminating enzyme